VSLVDTKESNLIKYCNNVDALQVTEITEYRAQLYDYLKSRMNAIAPNLTVLVWELVGARLIYADDSFFQLDSFKNLMSVCSKWSKNKNEEKIMTKGPKFWTIKQGIKYYWTLK